MTRSAIPLSSPLALALGLACFAPNALADGMYLTAYLGKLSMASKIYNHTEVIPVEPTDDEPEPEPIVLSTDMRVSLKNANAFSAAVGYRFPNSRFELSYTQSGHKVDVDKSNVEPPSDAVLSGTTVDTQSLMLNAIYDFDNPSWFTPFVGLGAGMVKVKHDLTGMIAMADEDDDSPLLVPFTGIGSATVFGLQALGGVYVSLTNYFHVILEARALRAGTGGFKLDVGSDAFEFSSDVNQFSVWLGVMGRFND